jgi:ATP-dependent helicase/nuclease subunit B
LDGFAELAPQEMAFLAALLPFCARATLAFNLEGSIDESASWLSSWTVVRQTVQQLRQRLHEGGTQNVTVEWLDRDAPNTRFTNNPVLRHLERTWSAPYSWRDDSGASATPPKPINEVPPCLRIVACADREAEARLAAREIRRFVRTGRRYRDVGVIVRNLDQYASPIRRVFSAYDIPFFLDRREPVGHHPLTELTRSALRTVTLGWKTEDWFGALKTGLVHQDEATIDRLENEALSRGWQGQAWLQPLKGVERPELAAWLEPLRQKLVAPFQQLAVELGTTPSGTKLSEALSRFWQRMNVADRLQEWMVPGNTKANPDFAPLVHATVWQQLQDWLDNVALAFAHESLALREWLPVLEAGLASQTVGVIPPALDQVLVGAADRSRNPNLGFALVLGMNEAVFPAVPREPNLITSAEREVLKDLGIELGRSTRRQLAQERYLAYVACTRPSERLLLTSAARDENDAALNPSPFLEDLRRQFPWLKIETDKGPLWWTECEHECELADLVLRPGGDHPSVPAKVLESLRSLPGLERLHRRRQQLEETASDLHLSPALVEALYGKTLQTSVSRLEEYAACPFRFLVTSGFRVEERKLFQLDPRQQGSFQHEILARFHQQLKQEHQRWRDLTPLEARQRIGLIADELIPTYQNGLLQADAHSRFVARNLSASLQEYMGIAITWMSQYQFDPEAVELAFGLEEKPLPAWEMDLGAGHFLSFRGKIDRIDLWRDRITGEARCVVIDYKSSAKRLDPVLLAHGIQLQLLAYLNVLRALRNPAPVFGVKRLLPAGVFFVNLRGQYGSAKTRRDMMEGLQEARALAYQHTGRFDTAVLRQLDSRTGIKFGTQFNFRLRQDGNLWENCSEGLETREFSALLDAVEGHLRRMGQEIFAGTARPDPYRKGISVACEFCQYRSICRIDPWTHPFRVLQAVRTSTLELSNEEPGEIGT